MGNSKSNNVSSSSGWKKGYGATFNSQTKKGVGSVINQNNSNKVTTTTQSGNSKQASSSTNKAITTSSVNSKQASSSTNKVTTTSSGNSKQSSSTSKLTTTQSGNSKQSSSSTSQATTTQSGNSSQATSSKEPTNNSSNKVTTNNNSNQETTNSNSNKVTTNQTAGSTSITTNTNVNTTLNSAPSNAQNTSAVAGSPVGTGTIYWFASDKIPQIENSIKNILYIYTNAKNNFMNLANKIKEYVNVGGKWNDANSKLFAQWWNGDMTGRLVVKPGQGLQIEASEKSYSIKEILNRCANLWWVAVCRQLYYVVNLKYPQQLNNMGELTRKCFMKGADESYSVAPINSENIWTNLMAELTSDTSIDWNQLNLPTENASNGGSSTTELETFIQSISKEIANIKTDLYQYIFHMNFIIQDTPNENYFFGFMPNQNLEMVRVFFENERIQFINNFQDNLKNALSMYDESVNNKINEYLSTKYNLN